VIVDTSALVAVVLREPGYREVVGKLVSSRWSGIGTPTLVELGLVLSARLSADPHPLIAHLLTEFEVAEVAFGSEHWREAVDAFLRFGRGRHLARLNFGDCLTYAVAKLAGEPLLFIGTDFAATDLVTA
jgi:ribonuclease VapC